MRRATALPHVPPAHRRRLPGLPADPPPFGVRQCRAAAARRRRQRRARSRGRSARCWPGSALPTAPAPARRPCRAASSSASRSLARSSTGPICWSPTSRPATSMPRWRSACCTCSPRSTGSGTTVVVATHDVGLISATPGAQLIRLENGSMVDPTGTLRNPPRERRRLMFDWLFASPAERRLLGEARPARSRRLGDRDHELLDHDHRRGRPGPCQYGGRADARHRGALLGRGSRRWRQRRARAAHRSRNARRRVGRSSAGKRDAPDAGTLARARGAKRGLAGAGADQFRRCAGRRSWRDQQQRVGDCLPGAQSSPHREAVGPLLRSLRAAAVGRVRRSSCC